MIVRNYNTEKNSERRIDSDGWSSVRLLLKDDGLGFSFHITTIHEGAELKMHYQNHLESVYCISGEGNIEDLDEGVTHPITPGVVYALDKHDRHILRAKEEMTMACVFSPPVTGKEVHNEDGAYPLVKEAI